VIPERSFCLAVGGDTQIEGEPVSDLSGAAQRAGNAIADAGNAIADKASQAGGHANEALNQIEDTIRRNPWLSVLTAATLGFTWARFRR
jgi:ElaB/YqjD/DUF883 family membrane-anchored ribosome-binding protein